MGSGDLKTYISTKNSTPVFLFFIIILFFIRDGLYTSYMVYMWGSKTKYEVQVIGVWLTIDCMSNKLHDWRHRKRSALLLKWNFITVNNRWNNNCSTVQYCIVTLKLLRTSVFATAFSNPQHRVNWRITSSTLKRC